MEISFCTLYKNEQRRRESMKEYHSPATLRLSSVDNEYGLAIGAVVLWAIGIVFGWIAT